MVRVCASAEAATDFSALVVFLSLSTLPALLATFLDIGLLCANSLLPPTSLHPSADCRIRHELITDLIKIDDPAKSC